jgi:ABC-type nitrate/sulfonate/bicarbonate transport system substrate-binding protein
MDKIRFHIGSSNGKAIVLAYCWVVIAIVALSTSLSAQQGPLQKIRVLCLNRPLPVVAAQSQGIFAGYGIDVEFLVRPNSSALRSDLAGGKGDVAFVAADNAVAMVELAGADVVIMMGGESSVNELFAQPEIKSIKDLRGRKILVDAPNTAYALQLKKVLQTNGLQPGTDYEMKSVGSTPIRLQAMMRDREDAATILNPPFSILAKHAGLVSLGTTRKLLGGDLDRATFAMRPWAREHADLIEGYLAGYVQGQRWLMAPANKSQVVALLMTESNVTEQIANEWYAAVIPTGGYAKDARFDVDGFKKTLQLRAEVEGGKQKTPSAEKYYDLSYYRAALKKIK